MRLVGHSPYRLNKPPAGSVLDPSHPLGTNVLAAWFGLEGGGRTFFDSGYRNWGYTYNGTLSWTPTQRVSPAQPVFGPALTFDGSTGYVTFPRITGFGTMTGLGPFTVSAWFLTNAFGTRRAVIADWSSSGINQSFAIQQGQIASGASNIISVVTPAAGSDISTGVTMVAATWYHVVVSQDAVRHKIWVNGRLVSDTATTTMVAGVTLAVGRAGAFNGLYWSGQIGPLMVYSRAFQNDEAKWLYAEPFSMLRAPMPYRLYPSMTNIKTIDGLAKGSVKTVDGLAIGSVKTWVGLP